MQLQIRVIATAAALVAFSACASTNQPAGAVRGSSGVVASPTPGVITFDSPAHPASESTHVTYTRETTQVNAVHLVPDGRHLIIEFVTGDGDIAARAYVDETSDEVDVHVLVTSVPGTYEAVGYRRTITVPLKAPLGGRRVVAAPGASVPMAGIGGAPASP
jgi:hypothetical protein